MDAKERFEKRMDIHWKNMAFYAASTAFVVGQLVDKEKENCIQSVAIMHTWLARGHVAASILLLIYMWFFIREAKLNAKHNAKDICVYALWNAFAFTCHIVFVIFCIGLVSMIAPISLLSFLEWPCGWFILPLVGVIVFCCLYVMFSRAGEHMAACHRDCQLTSCFRRWGRHG